VGGGWYKKDNRLMISESTKGFERTNLIVDFLSRLIDMGLDNFT